MITKCRDSQLHKLNDYKHETNLTKHEFLLPLETCLFKKIMSSSLHVPKKSLSPNDLLFPSPTKRTFPTMARPQLSTYPNLGEWAKETLHYQQAVKIGHTIKISGQGSPSSIPSHPIISFRPIHWSPSNNPLQGGWDPNAATISIPSDLDAEIAQAFSNVELALKTAGGEGWKQVYSVRSYHIPVDEGATGIMAKNLREWCGVDHRPVWTAVGVSSLGAEGMRVEIEVEAWVG
jgi:enamine deaminase RidA (YjgF/YER057c/UK114 family)